MLKSLTYTVLLRTSPNLSDNSNIALNFCKALIQEGHQINCLFLQNDAAYLGLDNYITLENETNMSLSWQKFTTSHKLPAYICSNSALRRGIFDEHFAEVYKRQKNLASMFQLASLGILFVSIDQTDRFIQL